LIETLVDLFLHLDTHLIELVADYGRWVYGLLFVVIFAETGLVVTPLLRATRCCSRRAPSPQRARRTSEWPCRY
jgi:hypothetical protein